MEKLTYAFNDGVAVITMDDGKANALGSQTWAELNEALDMAEKDDAIVVMSKGSKFARRIMAHPRPVIMAAPGHTIAMGAFLALACDYSFIKAGNFKVGLNETLIGMTMHNFGRCDACGIF